MSIINTETRGGIKTERTSGRSRKKRKKPWRQRGRESEFGTKFRHCEMTRVVFIASGRAPPAVLTKVSGRPYPGRSSLFRRARRPYLRLRPARVQFRRAVRRYYRRSVLLVRSAGGGGGGDCDEIIASPAEVAQFEEARPGGRKTVLVDDCHVGAAPARALIGRGAAPREKNE